MCRYQGTFRGQLVRVLLPPVCDLVRDPFALALPLALLSLLASLALVVALVSWPEGIHQGDPTHTPLAFLELGACAATMWWPIVASTPSAEPTATLHALDEDAAFNMACHVVCIKGFVAPRWFWVPDHSTRNLDGGPSHGA